MIGKIIISNLGKAYKQYPNQWMRLLDWVSPTVSYQRFIQKWALQSISFTVNPGEALGIIGRNGAGKSTLLKLITGTIKPTSGTICSYGRVVALLELGIGFHPEFTGRQNAIMAGQLLGIEINKLNNLMDEIADFAEIGDYLDQPFRTYSSGMQMRLAFSVATAVRPDILIVDEALSVGDSFFVHKCYKRIKDFRNKGTTLLVVSHDKGSIQSICDRAILIDEGRLLIEGDPEIVINHYNALLSDNRHHLIQQVIHEKGKIKTISGTGEASIESVSLVNENGDSLDCVFVGDTVVLRVLVRINQNISSLVLGYLIKDYLGQPIYGTNTYNLGKIFYNLTKNSFIEYFFKFDANIGVGTYSVSLALHEGQSHIDKNYEWQDLSLIFTVVNLKQIEFVGVTWLPPTLECVHG
jgi:lipopolysaccharide transport system ATP-binding protein